MEERSRNFLSDSALGDQSWEREAGSGGRAKQCGVVDAKQVNLVCLRREVRPGVSLHRLCDRPE